MIKKELLPYVVAGTFAVTSLLEAVVISQQTSLLIIKDQQIAKLVQLYNGEVQLFDRQLQFTNDVLQQNFNLAQEILQLRKAK